jgi:hypothetical protein
MDVNEALELADGSALPWAPVLAAEVRQLRAAVAFYTTAPDIDEPAETKAPNNADLHTMEGIGYPARLSPTWLNWIAAQLDELERLRRAADHHCANTERAIERVRELCNRGIAEPFQGSWAHYVLRALDGEDQP